MGDNEVTVPKNEMDQEASSSSIKIGLKPFLTGVFIILALIITSGVMTKVIPAGHFERVEVDGRVMVVEGSYQEDGMSTFPVWRWATAFIEVLWGDNWLLVSVLTLFIFFLGGALHVLEKGQVLEAMMALAVKRFKKRKYLLMALLMFIMMFLASVVGIYEALVPLVVLIVPLSLAMGWDSLVGLGMSLMSLAFGFSAAVTNPFTIAVAQSLADLPIYSGAWLRILFFAAIYIMSFAFLFLYARKIEKNPEKSLVYKDDEKIRHKYSSERIFSTLENLSGTGIKKAMIWFGSCLILSILFIILSAIIPALPADYSLPIIAVMFLIGGLGAGRFLGYKKGLTLKYYLQGALNLAPGILLILLAMSVPHIMTKAGVLDTILYKAGLLIQNASSYTAGFLIYILTLFLNFFIGSASAKAFLMVPILAPLCDIVGITRQTMVMAFDFGDGFSNMIYPTNVLLLIGLSFASVSYTKWMRFTWLLQILFFIISMGFLAIAVTIGFGPF